MMRCQSDHGRFHQYRESLQGWAVGVAVEQMTERYFLWEKLPLVYVDLVGLTQLVVSW